MCSFPPCLFFQSGRRHWTSMQLLRSLKLYCWELWLVPGASSGQPIAEGVACVGVVHPSGRCTLKFLNLVFGSCRDFRCRGACDCQHHQFCDAQSGQLIYMGASSGGEGPDGGDHHVLNAVFRYSYQSCCHIVLRHALNATPLMGAANYVLGV
ncbi:hypothetical protein PsAD2_01379 [Pseudovibrio axinellae]|uniref:Uncharacterized protein n=1 Tax=Pseudovibrio axinellae TaxID=989403 RepID=A0A166A1G5_9HYPH|nr:hypothetical protein PsAD2_01379 [Pseudovibrio axinellae]SEQ91120.1 hypothetical protein SAMN05421798_10589 [Pseudovibrio axinellae]